MGNEHPPALYGVEAEAVRAPIGNPGLESACFVATFDVAYSVQYLPLSDRGPDLSVHPE